MSYYDIVSLFSTPSLVIRLIVNNNSILFIRVSTWHVKTLHAGSVWVGSYEPHACVGQSLHIFRVYFISEGEIRY